MGDEIWDLQEDSRHEEWLNNETGLAEDIQKTLWDEDPPERELTIQERFEIFHEANPEVYKLLVKMARVMLRRGRRIGIKCLWENLRYRMYVAVDSDVEFKLPNDYTSRYARLIMEQEPEFDDFFSIRELRS